MFTQFQRPSCRHNLPSRRAAFVSVAIWLELALLCIALLSLRYSAMVRASANNSSGRGASAPTEKARSAAARASPKTAASKRKKGVCVCGLCNKSSSSVGQDAWGSYATTKHGQRQCEGDQCGECKVTRAPVRAIMSWGEFKDFAHTTDGGGANTETQSELYGVREWCAD